MKRLNLVNFLHVSVCVNFFTIQSIVCVSKPQKRGLVFSPFPELVSISKQLKRLDLVNYFHVLVCFSFSLYNPLFQCFERSEMGPGIFTFFRACFNFVSKQLKRLDLVNFFHVSVCFNFFPI